MLRTTIFMLALTSVFSCAAAFQGPDTPADGVRFTYRDPAATSVSIAGDFNRWDPSKDRFAGPAEKGLWSITLPLADGRYEYRFVVNGREWVLDPSAPSVDDGMGGRNSVVVVAHQQR